MLESACYKPRGVVDECFLDKVPRTECCPIVKRHCAKKGMVGCFEGLDAEVSILEKIHLRDMKQMIRSERDTLRSSRRLACGGETP